MFAFTLTLTLTLIPRGLRHTRDGASFFIVLLEMVSEILGKYPVIYAAVAGGESTL